MLVNGEGIRLALDEGEPVIGFFATRVVFGKDEKFAENKAKAILLAEWRRDGLYANDQGLGPKLNTVECSKITFLNAILKKRSGFTFYRDDHA